MRPKAPEQDPALAEPTTYVTTWTRGADGAFNDLKKERFATLLAAGKNLREASDEVGIAHTTAFAWAKHPDMKVRKRALRATPAISQTFCVSIAMIVAELHANATKAREAGDYRSSNDALNSMYKISKAEKSLLETFDAKTASRSGDVVSALQAHLSKAQQLPQSIEAEGEEA